VRATGSVIPLAFPKGSLPAELRRGRRPAVDGDRAGGPHAQPVPRRPARLRRPGRLGFRNLAPGSCRRPRRTSGVRRSWNLRVARPGRSWCSNGGRQPNRPRLWRL